MPFQLPDQIDEFTITAIATLFPDDDASSL